MCRIFGMTGVPDWELLEAVGLDFQSFNFHAAGAAIWTSDRKVFTIKQPGLWEDLIDTPEWERFRSRDAIAVICHVRHATGGDPKHNKNNHPFKTDFLVGFHHGIISNHLAFRVERTLEVDSEVIFRLLEDDGNAVHGLVGWAAIAYFDLRRPGVTFLGASRQTMGIEPKGQDSRIFISGGDMALGWAVTSDWIMRVEQDGLMYRERPFALRLLKVPVLGGKAFSWKGHRDRWGLSSGTQGSFVGHG